MIINMKNLIVFTMGGIKRNGRWEKITHFSIRLFRWKFEKLFKEKKELMLVILSDDSNV